MKPSNTDPYSPPEADLKTLPAGQHLLNLPRVSTWTVLGFTILSLGLYYTWWLFSRSRIINQLQPGKIPDSLAWMVILLLLANFTTAFYSGMYPNNLDLEMYSNIINLIASLASLYWVFTVRNRLHSMAQASNADDFWLNGVLTFFLQVLYMQYKINEYIDSQSTEASLAI